MISLERLEFLLHVFPKLTVGLVGDLFLDRYLEIDAALAEVSIETGLEAHQVTHIRNQPGALGTVMNNLAALGAGCLKPVTVIGDDGLGYDLMQAIGALPVDSSFVLRAASRLTPTYVKPLGREADGSWHELNRLDVRSRSPLTPQTRLEVCEQVERVLGEVDGLIILDQLPQENQGVVHDEVRAYLERLHRGHPQKLMFIDSRRCLDRFTFGVLKGNRAEILEAWKGGSDVAAAARGLAARTTQPVFCTLGESGSLVARPDGSCDHVPGYPVSGPVDIVGAGDSASSGILLSLLAGATDVESAAVGNLVASITVQQLGTTGTATPQQVVDRWHQTRR